MHEPVDEPQAFHILALSGGGFRGLYTATVLRHLEELLGEPIGQRFDLICGTSVGGLLALGIAAGISTAKLQGLFTEHGKKIFGARDGWRRWWPFRKWMFAKHSGVGLRAALAELFGEKTLGDVDHRVLVPAINYTTGRCQVFKTPHAPNLHADHRRRVIDVALATSAAPTYFPLHRIDDLGVFADGGLVANSPGFFGLHEARHYLKVEPVVKVRVLAIGTMSLGATLAGSESLDRGVLRWKERVFDLTIAAQESATHFMLQQHLGPDYMRIDDEARGAAARDVAELDRFGEGAVRVLKESGEHAAQTAAGLAAFAAFRAHRAPQARFFHGPQARLAAHGDLAGDFARP